MLPAPSSSHDHSIIMRYQAAYGVYLFPSALHAGCPKMEDIYVGLTNGKKEKYAGGHPSKQFA